MGSPYLLFGEMGETHTDPLTVNEYGMMPPKAREAHGLLPETHVAPMSSFPGMGITFADGTPVAPVSGPAAASALGRVPPPTPIKTELPHMQCAPISGLSDGISPAGMADHRLSISSVGEIPLEKMERGRDGVESNISPDATAGDLAIDDGLADMAEDDDGGDTTEGGKRSRKGRRSGGPPSWSEMKTKAGKDRKRLPLACIACRRKKIRCSGEKPACKHCLRSRIPCVYKVATRKAAPRTDYMAMLDKRLKRMEDRVIRLIPKDGVASMAGVGRAVVKPAIPGSSAKTTGTKKRAAEDAFGAGLEEWASTKSTIPKSESYPSSADRESEESSLLTDGAESLPSKEIQEHLAEVYFDYVYGQTYPLLHKPSFMRRLTANALPPVLVHAVCAISARFSSHPQVRSEPAFLRGEKWASAASEIALRRFDKPNITILIVYLLLGLHEFGTCQGGRSWMFCGMAQRMAYALQLHKDLDRDSMGHGTGPGAPLSFTDREIRRRTMWSCFLMDRFTSSGTDRPMFIDKRFLKVQLPIQESYFQMEIPGPTEDLDGYVPHPVASDEGHPADATANMGVAAYVIRLVAIWGRMVKYMNLGGKERDQHPMWAPESRFQQIKAQALALTSSLPLSLRYNEENLQNHATEKMANQFLFMHILSSQILLFMHRFALPAGSLPEDDSAARAAGDNPPPRFIAESAQTAMDAANQISALIKDAWEHRVVAPFAGYSAFFSSTVHVQGVFSTNAEVKARSSQNLAVNVRYLSRMKKYWGMLHFMAENLKELYRQHADAARRGPTAGTEPSSASASASGPIRRPGSGAASDAVGDEESPTSSRGGNIFQYGDWFDHYPNGVSKTDYEDPAEDQRREAGTDSALGQRSDLQSVEEFFATLATPTQGENRQQRQQQQQQRKAQKKGKHAKSASASDAKALDAGPGAVTSKQQQARYPQGRQRAHGPERQSNSKPRRSSQARPATDHGVAPSLPLDTSGFDPSAPAAIFHSPVDSRTQQASGFPPTFQPDPSLANHHVPPYQQQHQRPQDPSVFSSPVSTVNPAFGHPIGMPGDAGLWNYDLGMGGMVGQSFAPGDPTAQWLLPFNVPPPEIRSNSGIFPDGYAGFNAMPMQGLEQLEAGSGFDGMGGGLDAYDGLDGVEDGGELVDGLGGMDVERRREQ